MDNWKSLYIFYISGTGNAWASSEWIADEAIKRGLKTVVQRIDRLENVIMPLVEEKPLIGFAFPTHGFNAAPIMLKFIAGFPTNLCRDVFLLNTRAGMKLYKLFMPGLSGNCDECGICIKECPTSSIKFVGNRPYWKLTCESCMRCLNRCPRNAIEAAHGMAIVFWLIFSAINAQVILLIIHALHIQPEVWWWKITADIIGLGGMILIPALLYRIMHYAMGFKPIRYLVWFTSLTALTFWRRYKFIKNNKTPKNSV